MKKLVATLLTLSLFWTQTGSALLPPYHQQTRELKAILKSSELQQALGSELIVSIQKNGLVYTIISENHEVDAIIVPEPTLHVGPMKFHVEFSEPRSR